MTGGLPFLVVRDDEEGDVAATATTPANIKIRVLAESKLLSQGTQGWQDYDVGFITGDSTRAVSLHLMRRPCNVSACPIFGTLWLDDFAIEKL